MASKSESSANNAVKQQNSSPKKDLEEEAHAEAQEQDQEQDSGSEDGEVEEESTNNEPEAPPLPAEVPPAVTNDDGWDPVWEPTAQAFYFYNRFTGASQWTNPRVPEAMPSAPGVPTLAPGVTAPVVTEVPDISTSAPPPPPPNETPVAGGYNPAIHGDYDPNAWYAQSATISEPQATTTSTEIVATDPSAQYAATAAFNRFTGRYQAQDLTPENFNDENKSKRQMNAFFDVDAAANSHDGKSLKAERSGKKLSKTELKQFKEKRKARKEEKRRAWLRD